MYRGSLVVKPLADGSFWEVKESFEFHTPQYINWILIPKGFLTDFASIPKAFWSIIGSPTSTKASIAAVCHDYLYHTQKGTREKADKAFLYLMEQDGVGFFKRYSMYYAVRVFGGSYWKGSDDDR